MRGLTLVVASSVPLIFFRVASSVGLDLFAVLIFAGTLALIILRRMPPIAILGIGALAGAVFYK